MATDYFAHAAYGITPEGKDLVALGALVQEAFQMGESFREDWEELSESEQMYEAAARVRELPGWGPLLEKLGAPPNAGLIYTGDEDDRPGRCATDADSWVVGYGLFAFPTDLPESFKDKAEWHTWVTCG